MLSESFKVNTIDNISHNNFTPAKIVSNKQLNNNSFTNLCKNVDKKKLAVGVAAGIGITALAIGTIMHGRVKKVPQFAQNVVFKKAQNIEEAMDFGKINFNIERYTGFSENDLDIINWINEGLVKTNNKAKGHIFMPNDIVLQDDIKDTISSMGINGEFCISRTAICEAKDFCAAIIKATSSCSEEEAIKQVSLKKLDEIFKTIGDFIKDYPDYQETLRIYQADFSLIYHEMGHLQHFKNISNRLIMALHTKIGSTHKETKLIELFDNSQQIASKITPYATTSPFEFVAEVFSKMCDGVKLDDDVIKLYKKLGGVLI